MGGRCTEGHHWDALIKKCLRCGLACPRARVPAGCVSYCESAHCGSRPGRFYDALLRKCIWCADVCGKRHPAECSRQCQTTPPPATTKRLAGAGVTPRGGVEDPSVFLYTLLALCALLLLSSVSFALAVFLRGSRARASTAAAPKGAKRHRGGVVQPGEEVGRPGQTKPADLVTSVNSEPSDDPSPTETCVCVHCFPDLRALSQGQAFYQLPVLPRAPVQRAGPEWTGGSPHTSGLQGPGGGGGGRGGGGGGCSSREMSPICSLSNRSVPQENWIG